MKGIVAQISGKYAVVLTHDGVFKKIEAASSMIVGDEVDINCPAGNRKKARFIAKAVSLAAAALLIFGIGHGAYSYSRPYSYIDLDINPSVGLTLNIYDRIINAEALNNEGEALISGGKLKNTRLSQGVSFLINSAAEQGYFNSEDTNTGEVQNTVLLTVSSDSDEKSQKIKNEIASVVEDELNKGNIISDVLVGEATLLQRDDARKVGTTPGKFVLIEEVMEAEPALELEELKSVPVKDLVAKAKANNVGKDKKSSAEKETSKNEETDVEMKSNTVSGSSSSNSKSNSGSSSGGSNSNNGFKTVWGEDKDNKASNESRSDSNKKNESKKSAVADNDDRNKNKAKEESKDGKSNKNSKDSKNNKDVKDNKRNNSAASKQSAKEIEKKLKQQQQKLKDELLKQIKEKNQSRKQNTNVKGQKQNSKGKVQRNISTLFY